MNPHLTPTLPAERPLLQHHITHGNKVLLKNLNCVKEVLQDPKICYNGLRWYHNEDLNPDQEAYCYIGIPDEWWTNPHSPDDFDDELVFGVFVVDQEIYQWRAIPKEDSDILRPDSEVIRFEKETWHRL